MTAKLGKDYDVLCANIVADILIAMRELFFDFMKDGASLLLSGIIDERLDEVLKAMKETGFREERVEQSAGWAAVLMKK